MFLKNKIHSIACDILIQLDACSVKSTQIPLLVWNYSWFFLRAMFFFPRFSFSLMFFSLVAHLMYVCDLYLSNSIGWILFHLKAYLVFIPPQWCHLAGARKFGISSYIGIIQHSELASFIEDYYKLSTNATGIGITKK